MQQWDQEVINGCAEARAWLKTPEGKNFINDIADDMMTPEEREFEKQIQAFPFPFRWLVRFIDWFFL